jgi:hypothetical protein
MTEQTRGSAAFTFKDPSHAAHALAEAEHMALLRARRLPVTPADLGRRAVRGYRVTPAVALVSAEIDRAIRTPDDRVIICMPPRESKSTTAAVLGCVEALRRDPNSRHILASYADTLAQAHSAAARAIIAEHGHLLGLRLSAEKTSVGRWELDGHGGGMLAAGILAGITGFGATGLLVVDDAIKNMQEADSPTLRRKVVHEFRATLMTRVHPGASMVVIGTRWHPEDLIGTLLAEEPDRWRYVNIPAIGEPRAVPDSLGRAAGEAMVSAVGRTAQDFADQRRAVGERTWWAEFQGVPASPEGNVIRREWLDLWRLPALPTGVVRTVVGVDPSDSGEGDAAGIVAASLTHDGVVVVLRDISEPMTPERWARAAIELAIDTGASEIAVEAFTAREGYLSVLNTAIRRYRLPHHVRVSSWPPKGDTTGRGRGDAMARSAKLIQGLETGTVRLVGALPSLEAQAVAWQAGAHQPDCIAALTICHDVLVHGAWAVTFASPVRAAQRASEPPAWMRRTIGGGGARTWGDVLTGNVVSR